MADVTPGLFARPSTRLTGFGRWQLDACASGLRKTNGDRLLGGSSAMFAFSNVLYLFPDELSSLRGRCFAFTRIPPSPVECLLFRHDESSFFECRALHKSHRRPPNWPGCFPISAHQARRDRSGETDAGADA